MNNLDNQTEYWNEVASSKRFTHPFDFNTFNSLVGKESKILDYGCGHGRISAELTQNGYSNVIGIDSSEEMVSIGKKENPELDLRCSSGAEIPFGDNSLDAIILHAVLTCIATDKGQKELITEITRVLRKGGLLYVSDYPLQQDDRNTQRYNQFEAEFGRYGIFRLQDGGVVRHHDNDWIMQLFSDFEQLEYRTESVKTMNGNKAICFQYFGRAV